MAVARNRVFSNSAAALWAATLAIALSLSSARAHGQALALAPVQQTSAMVDAELDKDEATLHRVFRGSEASRQDDASLSDLADKIAPVQADVDGLAVDLAPRLTAVQARLAQLGPPPAPNAPQEDPSITAARREQTRIETTLNSEIKRAKLLSVEARQLSTRISEEQRDLFSARLTKRTPSVLEPTFWSGVAANLPRDGARVAAAAREEASTLHSAMQPVEWAVLALALALALALVTLVPSRLNALIERACLRLPPVRLRRSLHAFAEMVVGAIGPTLAAGVVVLGLRWANALDPTADDSAFIIVAAVFFAAFTAALGRALLAPGRRRWRLAPLSEALAESAGPFPGLIGLAFSISFAFERLAGELGLSLAVSTAGECLTAFLQLVTVAAGLLVIGRAREEAAEAHGGEADPADDGLTETAPARPAALWVVAALVAWVAIAVGLIAILSGYVALAIYIGGRLIWIGALLGALYLMLQLADDVSLGLASPHGPVGRFARRAIGLDEDHVAQIGVLGSGLARLLLLLAGWGAILAPFGANSEDVLQRFQRVAATVHIGDVSISPSTILGGVALFVIGVALTRGARRWLDTQYLPKTRLDMGARTSLSTVIGYIGFVLAAVLALAYLGISLDRIALIASALSVGIGFGLQAVIGNFVSGLILMVERPIRVGDWVVVGDAEGDVKRINVRATEIQRFDRSKLIVPNSELVSKTVRNITHADAIGRVRIVLNISGEAEPARVRDILNTVCADHPDVLGDPAPVILLNSIGASGSEIDCFAYVSGPRRVAGARSDLLFAIDAAFRREGISFVPSTQDVYLRPSEPLDALIGALSARRLDPKAAVGDVGTGSQSSAAQDEDAAGGGEGAATAHPPSAPTASTTELAAQERGDESVGADAPSGGDPPPRLSASKPRRGGQASGGRGRD